MAVVGEFADRANGVADIDTLSSLVEAAARDLGFRYFALVQHVDLAHPPPRFLFVQNYPSAWVETFRAGGLHRLDPAQRLAAQRVGSFTWADLPLLTRLTSAQGRMLDEARRAGLGAGFTVPLHAPGERIASCSFVAADGREIPERTLLAAELIAHIAFRTAFGLLRPSGMRNRPQLTPRQQECVALMAQGKSDWEIGAIMGLSEETVTKYLNAARLRFGVARRTQLALAAVSHGQLSLDELISWQ